jgi:hypothetical protein
VSWRSILGRREDPRPVNQTWQRDDAIESIARALCQAEGFHPDHTTAGIPRWHRHIYQASIAWQVITGNSEAES